MTVFGRPKAVFCLKIGEMKKIHLLSKILVEILVYLNF